MIRVSRFQRAHHDARQAIEKHSVAAAQESQALRRRRRRTVGGATVTGAVGAATIAIASGSASAYSRQRSGVQEWVPDLFAFEVELQSSTEQHLYWTFSWGEAEHVTEANGLASNDRAFEVKAKVSSAWADDYLGSWGSTIPEEAGSYFDDQLFDNEPGLSNFGAGTTEAWRLNSATVSYEFFVGVDTGTQTSTSRGFTVEARAASFLEDSFPISPCGVTRPSLCVFSDYRDQIFTPVRFSVPNNIIYDGAVWPTDWPNVDFEQGDLTGFSTSNNINRGSVNQDAVPPQEAYEDSHYYSFKSTTGVSTIWHDEPMGLTPTGDGYSFGVAVRCPANNGTDYDFEIGYKDVFQGQQNQITSSSILSIPDDWQWYVCRIDANHVDGTFTGWPSNGGSDVRMFVRNLATDRFLHVDDWRFSGNLFRAETGSDPEPWAPIGPDCTLASLYNT